MYRVGQGRSHTPAPADGHSFMVPLVVSASKTSGVVASVRNDEPEAVIATITQLEVTTRALAAVTFDVGVGADKTATYDNLLDGIPGDAVGIYDNITDKTANATTRQLVQPGQYWTIAVATGNANGFAGNLYLMYQRRQGGSAPP